MVSDEFGKAVDELDVFASNNKETQGKKTIGEEKVDLCRCSLYALKLTKPQMYNVFMRLDVSADIVRSLSSPPC